MEVWHLMMINKRLISTIGRSKKYIAGNVIVQWLSMIFNIVMIFSIANLLGKLAEESVESGDMIFTICAAVKASFPFTVIVQSGSFMLSGGLLNL